MTHGKPSRYLVFGATGKQGGAIARALSMQGKSVRGFAARRSARALVPLATGDLADPTAVGRAFEGITHAAVTLPLVYDPERVATFANVIADAARTAEVRQLVYNTNTPLPPVRTEYPALETRRVAEDILRAGGVPMVVLRPPVYLENLFNPGVGGALMSQGVLAYPLPADRRVAWLTHADLAGAVVAALDRPELAGSTVDVGGAEVVTGPELAGHFSASLGREVRYLPLEVDAFEQGLSQALGAEAADAVTGLYRFAGTDAGRHLFDLDPTVLSETFGVAATPIASWVAAQPWRRWSAVPTSDPG
ncbi:NmrA family NAD(P)-binding protein [Solwaraspora sp. WMMD1047]|uniref:SDR family oxidoreductase n=1 Tax=Solwaraspora sp. WMMD1047 TaxID=3016102 RepID=UPI0024175E95|nr:NmrA family NAD(P)-binding protein [Solwaraspora sp. WMMD1047]MDG4832898.1 NmrA family NAD(P)-binding protein [Solwaraspora sp. WMMD1047]